MQSVSRVSSAGAATVSVAALMFGAPTALWFLTRPLITTWTASPAPIPELLLRPDDGTVLLSFLAVVATAAWLVLALSIVVELTAAVLHRPGLHIDLPGFRWGHGIAAALIAAMLGSSPAIAAPLAMAVTVVAAAETPPRTITENPPADGPTYTVKARDSLWRIAETVLGDPLRWREIFDLNAGRPQQGGAMLTEGSILEPGWVLQLPTDARTVVRVEAGDTLSGLADAHLGDASRAPELYAANAGRPEPNGAVVSDPDLILPGWTLVLPPPATSPTSTTPPPRASPPAPAPRPIPADPTPDPVTTPAPSPVTPAPGAPAPEAPPDVTSPSDTAGAPSPAPTIAALGVSALVATGFVTALKIRRRRQLRMRTFRHQIAVPDDEAGRAEWSATHGPTTSTANLDLALRSLAAANYRGITVPRIRAVRLTEMDGLISLAIRASLPPPFVAVGDEDDWTLDADAPLPESPDDLAARTAPFPALVSVATDDERTLLIDLEQRCVLRLGGNHQRAIALMRHIAAELATSHMAEDAEVVTIGLGDDLPTLEPDRLRVAHDLGTALAEVEYRAETARAAASHHQLDGIVRGRFFDLAADAWLPTILLVAEEPGPAERTRIDALAALTPGTAPIAIVLVDQERAELTVDDDGGLHLPDIDDGPWQAGQLSDQAGIVLAEILESTDRPSSPPGPAANPQTWADGMAEDGSLTATGEPTGPDVTVVNTNEPARDADPKAVRRLAVVEHQDPDLDADLELWNGDAPPAVPMIGILGEPVVRAPGPRPSTRPNWFTEVLVYLALHPSGVSPAKAASDLWPDGHRISPATIRHAFFGARRWAGSGYDGDPNATYVTDMHQDTIYRLRGHLLDWDLLRRLRKRAQARHDAHHPGAAADYEAALALIRGPVLSGLRPGGYAWLNNHDQRHDLQIPCYLIDTAHELVDIALAAGDTVCARRAAERARSVDNDVTFDRPLTDLMRIAHAEDNHAELELYAALLLDARGFDVPEDLAPESFAVLNELLPTGPRRPRP